MFRVRVRVWPAHCMHTCMHASDTRKHIWMSNHGIFGLHAYVLWRGYDGLTILLIMLHLVFTKHIFLHQYIHDITQLTVTRCDRYMPSLGMLPRRQGHMSYMILYCIYIYLTTSPPLSMHCCSLAVWHWLEQILPVLAIWCHSLPCHNHSPLNHSLPLQSMHRVTACWNTNVNDGCGVLRTMFPWQNMA
jgi:hypothetical protein